MRRALLVLSLVLLVSPVLVSAKSPKLRGFERDKGKEIAISEPLGWPVTISTSAHVEATLESFPGMSVVRLSTYEPWWQFWGDVPATSTVRISGLPKATLLHIYKQGYRVHLIATTTPRGTLILPFRTEPGDQFIIKSRPSTKHITDTGGDCNSIGNWDSTSKTCTLSSDVFETIAIEDNGVTLNGNGKSVRGSDSGDGIYADESDVRITNIEVHHFDRGIVYSDSLFTLASGGQIDGTTLADNILNIMDEGVSNLYITDNDIVVAQTGVSLVDQFDGFATDGIVITRNNFKLNSDADIFNDGTSFVLNTTSERGNWWERNTGCTQDSANPDFCTSGYTAGPATDNQPWVCENAWRTGVA
ncbi:MAG: hypothetical protein AAB590_02625, partial [Patescibacteria group bacterium]